MAALGGHDGVARRMAAACGGVHFAVLGGGGYLGRRLAISLLRNGAARVVLFDRRLPDEARRLADASERVVLREGDVRDPGAVEEAVRGSSAVFHLASYGMSGAESAAGGALLTEDINVGGTRTVVRACLEEGVNALVYTSTVNVVFGGAFPQAIRGGRERDLPYLDPRRHCDAYSRTKAEAERIVLAAAAARPSSVLLTAALRAAGIFGEREERHLPRILGYVERGLFAFSVGARENETDFVYVDNLVDAHVLAAGRLLASDPAVGGEAFFVTNGEPSNNFEFFRPLLEGLGYPFPRWRLPYAPVFFAAWLIELAHAALPVFRPLLTRAEVNKTGVQHTFSIEKAERLLGYRPRVSVAEGWRRVLDALLAEGHHRTAVEERRRRQRDTPEWRAGRRRQFGVVAVLSFSLLALSLLWGMVKRGFG